jgi:hypothetical protein
VQTTRPQLNAGLLSILAPLVRRLNRGSVQPVENPCEPARNSEKIGEEKSMRFMMLMIPKVYRNEQAGFTPPAEAIARMSKFNESLTKAGVLLALDGLHTSHKGARVAFSGGKPTITDGPFTEAKEIVGGYWMIQVKSKDEAVQWASRCPADDGDIIEVRQVYEMEDFAG